MSRLRLILVIHTISLGCAAAAAAEDLRRDGLIDRLQSGVKFAQGLLGSESVAMKVAELVVRAFQTAKDNNNHDPTTTPVPPAALPMPTLQRPFDYQQHQHHQYQDAAGNGSPSSSDEDSEVKPPMSALRQLVRLLGLEPGQLGAVAVNALLFVSQMIATFLTGPARMRPTRADISTAWLTSKESQPLQELLAAARNDSLADAVQELVKEQGSPEETSCLRLLACKVAPFVVNMQQAVFGPDHGNHGNTAGNHSNGGKGVAALYRHLPSKSEMLKTGDACEIAHRECDLNEV